MFFKKFLAYVLPKQKSLFKDLHTPSCGIPVPPTPPGFIEWLEDQTNPQMSRLHDLIHPLTQIPEYRKKSYGWMYENLHKNEACRNHPNYPEIMQLLGEIVI